MMIIAAFIVDGQKRSELFRPEKGFIRFVCEIIHKITIPVNFNCGYTLQSFEDFL
jgi:hypothetical protein